MKVPKTRTRNGCERCRAKRRKCDLRKPVCQRCADASAGCEYTSRSFVYYEATGSCAPASNVPEGAIVPQVVSSTDLEPKLIQDLPRGLPLSLSEDSQHLLKHYVAHIAPWMDVGDRRQVFGRLVPQLAVTYPPILDAILQIAAQSSRGSLVGIDTSNSSFVGLQQLSSVTQTSGLSYLLPQISWVLHQARSFIEDVPETWDNIYMTGGEQTINLMGGQFDCDENSLAWLAVVRLTSRLELAWALISEMAPTLPAERYDEAARAYWRPRDALEIADVVLDAYYQSIGFLTDASRLCFKSAAKEPVDGGRLSAPMSRFALKAGLLTKVRGWYDKRPQQLIAMEQGGRVTHSGLPMISFVCEAAAAANMMHHFTQLLLLVNAPVNIGGNEMRQDRQLVDLTDEANPLWHAMCVCGIALASDQKFWDPVMIAAFFVAMQHIVDSSQRTESLACLHKLEETGWRVNGLVTRVQDAWAS